MSETLKDHIDEVWQSADGYSKAISIARRMSPEETESLNEVLANLVRNSRTELSAISDDEGVRNAFITPKAEEEEFASILLLLMLAIHHSDGLLFLPPNLRQSRIRSWAEQTGFKEAVVREALRLGPEGLQKIL